MDRVKMGWILAIGLVAVSAAPSSASTITATYTGLVTSGVDSPGMFGSPGTDLAGANYKLVFTLDPALGSYSAFSGGDSLFGGVSASLTINGHSDSFAGPHPNSYALTSTGPSNLQTTQTFSSDTGQVFAAVRAPLAEPGFPSSIYSPYTTSSCPGVCQLFFDVVTTGGNGGFHGVLAFGTYSLGPTPIAPTPLPGSLPLMISALGGLGLLRRRHLQRATV